MHKFRTKDQNGKSNNLGDDNWVWQGVKLHEIKSLKASMGTIKRNWKNKASIKIFQSQIKNPKWRVIQT
jgi:hypothetical protein